MLLPSDPLELSPDYKARQEFQKTVELLTEIRDLLKMQAQRPPQHQDKRR